MDLEKPITTQEDFDAKIKERLEREREKIAKEVNAKYQDYEALKSELTKAKDGQKELEKLQNEIAGYKRAELKRKIAMEYKIPYDLADRIQGEDEEAMISDAKNLQAYFKRDAPPLKNIENTPKKEDAYKKLLNGLKGE